MSKFNKQSQGIKTENLAGGEAYKLTDKISFVTFLLTSFVTNQFYKDEQTNISDAQNMVKNLKDKKFAAKAAVFARNEFGMRSITHIIAGEIAKLVKEEEWTKYFFNAVVRRTDDITEILSYYLNTYNKPVPNSLRKGLKMAFNKFDAYQLAKYRGEGKELSLIDAVNLLHPKGNDKNSEALKKLVEGALKSKTTWNVGLTEAGKTAISEEDKAQKKAQVWVDFVNKPELEYFALLRNLRNISEQAPSAVDKACQELMNENRIKKSLVLPFRYLTAYDEINNMKIRKAINRAVEISLNNIPKFDGKTLICLDTSGSMSGWGGWTGKADNKAPGTIGSLFAAALVKTNDCDFMEFDGSARYKFLNTDDTLITLAHSTKYPGGTTNFHSIFRIADKAYDRIIILSDMQGWVEHRTPQHIFEDYKRKFNCDPFVYSFDLAGHGTSQFAGNKILTLAGFSEKIFDIMKIMEQDKNALISTIEEIKF
jgi:hypothetical protein